MKESNCIIQVFNLRKRYGDVQALDGVTFEVRENEIFGLLGPNGAGKTTTIEILETLIPRDDGKVSIMGLDPATHSNIIKQNIGVQFQSAAYYPRLSLEQIIGQFAGLYGLHTYDADELLSKVNLLDKRKKEYKNLSGGQQQRFSLALTLLANPKIIFLDEPSTGLDPQARRSLWNLIKEINKKGTTIVLSTHFMDEAEVLCDNIAIMDRGVVKTIGSPSKLIDNLIESGFQKEIEVRSANLEDVFLDITGRNLVES